jgi:hypothetical protein
MQLAQQAKAEGRRSLTTGFIPERDSGSSLRDVYQRASIVVAVAAGDPRVQVGEWITTAQDFRVERWLRRVPPPSTACVPWPGVAEDDTLVTTRIAKGTALIDGVSITNTSQSGLAFSEGQRYLFLVHDCPGRRIEFTYWLNSVFNISIDDQIIVPDVNQPEVGFVQEIAELKTLSALEQAIDQGQHR